ncbi:MAG: HAD family hydrolase [Bacteroidales bacterium]|nr:HAD family hydrolase [Bacteroidales bacterium]
MIKLLIFDFDGTLADTHELIIRTNQEAMRRMGFPVLEDEVISRTIGLPLEEGLKTMFPELTQEDLPAWVKTYRTIFDELKTKIIPRLFPHVKETLQALHAQGYVLTVASSRLSLSLNAFLRDMGIAPFFSYVLGADNVSLAKPDPEPVLKTLRDLHFRADEALVVGDMPVDILMGKRAGAFTCGVTNGNSDREALKEAGANHVLDDFGQLPSVIG